MAWLFIQLVLAIILLSVSANRFIMGASGLAKHFKWPPLIAGILLVGFGTSFPELVVSLIAALKGHAGLSIGNAIGSNIANIGLVLGITAIFYPIAIHKKIARYDMVILFVVTIAVGLLFLNHYLGLIDGLLLVVMLILYLWLMFRRVDKDESLEELLEHKISLSMSWVWWVLGLMFIFISSEWLIRVATNLALQLGVSTWLIGLTVVALGTSLPELVTTLISAHKKEHGIALGNVIGSSVFNLLAVLALPALLSPTTLPRSLLLHDYPAMVGITLVLWLLLVLARKGRLSRLSGVILLLCYIGYLSVFVL